MKKAISPAIIAVVAIIVIAAGAVLFTSTKASPAQSNGPGDFAKNVILGTDKGDYQSFLGNYVDETGEKSKYQDTEKSISAYRDLLGSNGENIRIDSVEVLQVEKAVDSDLKQALPANTKISELYNVKLKVTGEATTKAAEGMLGTTTLQVAKANGAWHFFGGRLAGSAINYEPI